MRRPRVDHSKIDLKINVYELFYHLARLEYYSIDGNLVKELIEEEKVEKRIKEIKEERNNLCILDNGKTTYPMRDEKNDR